MSPSSAQPAQRSPIVRELVRHALESIADEMALTVVRTAYSNTLRDVMDFSTAICLPSGEMVVQGLTLPLHLGAFPDALASVLGRFGDALAPGDVYVMNDPYSGGMHLPDVFVFKPVFAKGVLVGFAAVVGHQADIGGRMPGGNACDSTEIYQEGLRIGPSRLVAAGKDVDDLWDMLGRNVRLPERVTGDLRAQIAALRVGERELIDLAERHSPAVLLGYFADLLDASESMARAEIRSWRDGIYSFVDFIDDDGITENVPVRLAVRIEKRGDELLVDFDGTSPQVEGAINSSLSSTRSAVMLTIRSLMAPEIPNNAGFFRAIRVAAPLGTLLNPRPPGAVAARALTCFRIVDTVMGALAQIVPDRVFAAGDGGISVLTAAGEHNGRPYVLMDSIGCCWGGRPDKDGMEGITTIALNISNIPAEIIEREYPLRLEYVGFVPDTGGAGKHRGGLALAKRYRFLAERTLIQIRSDRRTHLPYGLAGGHPGSPSNTLLEEGLSARQLPSKTNVVVPQGAAIWHQHAGGGGWGDPRERSRSAVLEDVTEGKVSNEAARALYGVGVEARPAPPLPAAVK